MKYDALTVMEDIVATQTSRLETDVPGEGGRGWSRTESSIEVGDDATLDEQWREDISRGARHLREESYVRVSEPHYDAKVWPVVHPYGTGSMLAEPGAGSAHKHAKNRPVLIQSRFRKPKKKKKKRPLVLLVPQSADHLGLVLHRQDAAERRYGSHVHSLLQAPVTIARACLYVFFFDL